MWENTRKAQSKKKKSSERVKPRKVAFFREDLQFSLGLVNTNKGMCTVSEINTIARTLAGRLNSNKGKKYLKMTLCVNITLKYKSSLVNTGKVPYSLLL